jgi:membrane-bound lytic murein transglycosylase D
MTGSLARGALAVLFAAAACHSAPPAIAPAPGTVAPGAAQPDTMRAAATRADTVRRDSTPIPVPEVTHEAVRLFGDSISAPTPVADSAADSTAAPAAAAAPAAPTWDIDVRSYETRQRVAFYVARFQGEARPRFSAWLQRGGRYEPMIRRKLKAAGLPEDLTYLALIESGYDPNAYSSAAAIGIWQLMTGTAQGTGLRVDWWIDERRDPVRSTDGAIKFLGWLNGQFGSLYLAAAAYNGGPGRVARGLTRYADSLEGVTGEDRFFALAGTDYLRAETRDYVPKLIAAALVAKEPAKYGLTITLDPPFAYDSVLLGPATPLAVVAKATGAPLPKIMELNNGVLRGMTPPSGQWWVRMPVGSRPQFDSAFAPFSSSEKSGIQRYTVKNSSSIATVSHKFGLSSRQFIWFNPQYKKNKSGTVSAGKTVLIPTAATLSAARDVPDPAIEKYGSSRRHSVTHVVKKGETLTSIANRYGTTAASIRKLNGLKTNAIYPGQVLLIKKGTKRK